MSDNNEGNNNNTGLVVSAEELALLDPVPIAAYIQAEFQRMRELMDEEHIAALIWERMSNERSNNRSRRHLNDNEGNNEANKRRRKKKDWDHERAYIRVVADYFDPLTPLFDDKQFERNLRITPTLAEIILNRLAATDEWWTLRWDCTKKMSSAPQVKLVAALKMAAYGESFSAWQDYCQMGESTARERLSRLMESLVDDEYFSGVYLRQMSRADARRVEQLHSQIHQVQGCLGSLDVVLLRGNCPHELQGQCQGRHIQPKTIALEAANDYNLWFWHYYFGEPESLNEIDVWEECSSLFEQMTNGDMQDNDFDFEINGKTFHQLYWLVDSIYPSQARFLKAVDNLIFKIDREFSSWQERHRKSIERGLVVLEKKFRVLANHSRLYYLDDVEKIVGGCIVLHNMMVKVRMDSDSQESEDLYQLVETPTNLPDSFLRH
jgi:hypothetical protein